MDVYLGQIGIFGFNFAPLNWSLCNGAILAISQNTALFSLLGTMYGGNGTVTFALPDLRSRTPIGMGNNVVIGEDGGFENVTLNAAEMGAHSHTWQASTNNSDVAVLDGHIFGGGFSGGKTANAYTTSTADVTLNPLAVDPVGGGQSHANIQPCLAVNFCIVLNGIFPPRS